MIFPDKSNYIAQSDSILYEFHKEIQETNHIYVFILIYIIINIFRMILKKQLYSTIILIYINIQKYYRQ